ncbi:hypothetical protein ABZP36_026545 [Zizania latifolia]
MEGMCLSQLVELTVVVHLSDLVLHFIGLRLSCTCIFSIWLFSSDSSEEFTTCPCNGNVIMHDTTPPSIFFITWTKEPYKVCSRCTQNCTVVKIDWKDNMNKSSRVF